MGKTIPARMPVFKLSFHALDTMPTRVGPAEHPTSPPKASIANSAVPPRGMTDAALLKVPGQKMPTESPHTAQPTRLSAGSGAREIHR